MEGVNMNNNKDLKIKISVNTPSQKAIKDFYKKLIEIQQKSCIRAASR